MAFTKQEMGAGVYFGVMAAYLAVGMAAGKVLALQWALLVEFVVLAGVLVWARKWFSFSFRFDWRALLAGLAIAGLWVALDPLYPHLGSSAMTPYTPLAVVVKLLRGVILAPLIEEFFTRSFFHRLVQAREWLAVPLGTYDLRAFVVTTVFFGLAHGQWLAGMVAGAIFNLLWYTRKDMNSVVVAHAAANLALGLIVVFTGSWTFWS